MNNNEVSVDMEEFPLATKYFSFTRPFMRGTGDLVEELSRQLRGFFGWSWQSLSQEEITEINIELHFYFRDYIRLVSGGGGNFNFQIEPSRGIELTVFNRRVSLIYGNNAGWISDGSLSTVSVPADRGALIQAKLKESDESINTKIVALEYELALLKKKLSTVASTPVVTELDIL